jgi:hypothetical protein
MKQKIITKHQKTPYIQIRNSGDNIKKRFMEKKAVSYKLISTHCEEDPSQ